MAAYVPCARRNSERKQTNNATDKPLETNIVNAKSHARKNLKTSDRKVQPMPCLWVNSKKGLAAKF